MKFTKRQLEIIAYSLSLLESDYEGKTQAEMHQILGTLQQKGIWGSL
jgi:hypothetical protein